MSTETITKLDRRPVKKPNGVTGKGVQPTFKLPQLPVGHRVAVIDDLAGRFSSAGIEMPDANNSADTTGTLVAAGLAALDVLHDHGVKLGDRVSWGAYAGQWQEYDDQKEILGVIRNVKVKYLMISVNDIVGSFGLADRIYDGKTNIRKGTHTDGRVQHYIEEK
jgi:co-chaperonin GroES (HSP10)